MDIQTLVKALGSPSIYPDNPKKVRVIETHISYLFFTGAYVYKIKKPVNFGFLDFTTLEKRRFFCLQEVRLNSRLSPDVYLGVEEINEKGGKVSLGGVGKTVEYAVKMRELPKEGMLSTLIAKKLATPELMDKIAFKAALFHRETQTNPEITEFGNISVIKKNAQENFLQTAPFVGRTVNKDQHDFISERSMDFIENNKKVFVKRMTDGRIRDCHGDVRLDSIFIEGECVQIIDCIEFNDRFRYADTAADVAFLAMDLDFNECFDLSAAFNKSYLKYSGDSELPLVLRFYKSYRAYVRGKVMSFMLDEPEVPEAQKTEASDTAKKYFGLAYSYFMQPTLIIMAGMTGTGKSAVAAALAETVGAHVIRTDEIRKKLAGVPVEEHRYEDYERGIYSIEFSERTYSEALREAGEILKTGRSVIIDASYKSRTERERAASLSRDTGVRFFVIECVCDEETVRSRLIKRLGDKEVSDGRWEVYEKQKREFEFITENEGRLIRIDSEKRVAESLGIILKVLGR